MIPALLTCLFVCYLYATLNAADSTDPVEPGPAPLDRKTVHALSTRLANLETRLQRISSTSASKGAGT